MSHRFSKTQIGFLLVAGTAPLVAFSQVYLTEDQATGAIFPGTKLTKRSIALTPEEVRRIEEKSGERVRNSTVTVWTGAKKEVLFVDEVLGKHEFITYAVGVADARVKAIEILEYRETFGQGVVKPEWRKQFVGKDFTAPLKLNQDIVNISGATLSSAHVTAGVRRLLQTYEVIKTRL